LGDGHLPRHGLLDPGDSHQGILGGLQLRHPVVGGHDDLRVISRGHGQSSSLVGAMLASVSVSAVCSSASASRTAAAAIERVWPVVILIHRCQVASSCPNGGGTASSTVRSTPRTRVLVPSWNEVEPVRSSWTSVMIDASVVVRASTATRWIGTSCLPSSS